MGYADDILIICDDIATVEKIINLTRSWCKAENMKLNEKKSGIIEFMGRRMRPKLLDKSVSGFPICSEYKYLGLRLTNKLSMKNQLDYLKSKYQELVQAAAPVV